jgi:CubicO group peptidase (beta-lactamase class C family)
MSAALTGAVVVALFLCSLTAGFLAAFSVVVMPGIRRLDDGAYLRAFQVMDGIIQDNSPLFIVMWVGSLVAMLSVLVLSVGSSGGPDRLLLIGAAGLYLGGVQLPTVLVNIPLNDGVQMLQIANLDGSAARAAREAFEPAWNRWNVIRTVVAVATVVMLLTAIAPLPASGQAPTRPDTTELARMDERIRAAMEAEHIPGVAVGVASEGRVLQVSTYGLSNVELGVPVSDSSVFEIGSISKQFVAAAILLLVEDGRVHLDDPIHEYLPELPGEWRGATIRHLLTHTSGIPDYEAIQGYEAYRFRFTPDEIIRVAHSQPMDFEPGTAARYSNTGYFVLSLLIERIEGRPLGEVLDARIFGPLRMTQTRMADPEDLIPHRAAGYWVDGTGERLINRDPTQTSSTLGAGGLVSSVHDMLKWDDALNDDGILSDASRTAMWTSAVLENGDEIGYGFGWILREYRGRRSVGHGGMVAGFVADFMRLPDDGVAIIVLANRYEGDVRAIRDVVADLFLPEA